MVDRTRRELTGRNVAKIADAYHRWRNRPETNEARGLEPYVDEPGFSRSVTKAEIETHGWVLTPGRYVGAADKEDDGVKFEEHFGALREKLTDQFAQCREIEARILQQLVRVR